VELIDSLRQDIERMRSAPAQPQAQPQPVVARAPQPVVTRAPQPVEVPPGAVQSGAVMPPKPKRRANAPHPIQDEWGFFDPEQCGFAALLAKLDEMTESCDEPEAHSR
jgi:hypothetical protein